MKEDVGKVRTFALISHGGAGKTSLAEAILFDAGVTTRLGKVDEGNSVMDYEPEEIKRKATMSTAFNTAVWNKHQLNIIDTPGDFNFIADTKTSMQGADAAIVIIDAIDGVRVQTEKVWEFADEFEQPRLIFVSKMDRERADFFRTLEDVRNNFGKSCVALQIPIGAAESFQGLVDILTGKAFLFTQGDSGKMTVEAIPADLADRVGKFRDELIEGVAESSDELLEKYLDGQELTPEEIGSGL
ncbi:MAG TPA: elongation factor G, partial [Syntrophobacteraceae bacterium]|nr:elongation factor G [Syntrophobacteraceae bacterium]